MVPFGSFAVWRSDPVVRQELPSGRVSLVVSDGATFRIDVDGRVVVASSFIVGMFDRPVSTLARPTPSSAGRSRP